MAEMTEHNDSDSWGMEFMKELLGKFTFVTGRIADNHTGDQDKHPLNDSKEQIIAKEVSKNMVTKKIVRRIRDDRYTSNTPSMDTWCRERKMKGYGPKIMHSQSTDFIEKKVKVEIKIEDSLENSGIISGQTSNTDILPSTDFIEKKI